MASDPQELMSGNLIKDFTYATKDAKFCANRIWSVAGMNLSKLLPPKDNLEHRVESMQRASKNRENRTTVESGNAAAIDHAEAEAEDHAMCTFDFCEYSLRDFTGVEQHHECAEKANCDPLLGLFSRKILERAAKEDKSTVWSLDGQSMIERSRSHMAISHVWSDGTGTGSWPDGEVNECLYKYFKQIAQQFQCEGIWWDTLCIPKEKAAREKAIRKIQSNYENARITLVHDRFLRNWKWDPETACFAIIMSPWFSRGWTALELAKSRKVKVIFKGPDGPVIKDLDEEVLSKYHDSSSREEVSKHHDSSHRAEASKIIRNLRDGVESVAKLLEILGPRYTSWPKDKAIISALLADVQIPKDAWQQDIYRSILTKFCRTRISPRLLLHNSPTMSQVSWCPTSLLNLPTDNDKLDVSQDTKDYPKIQDDLSLVGTWTRIAASKIPRENFEWRFMHPFIKEKLKLHLQHNPVSSHLLFERTGYADRAILVEAVKGLSPESSNYPVHCSYVGAVSFRAAQVLSEGKDVEMKLLAYEDPEGDPKGNSAHVRKSAEEQTSNDP
jgi:hypothetical protein